MVPLLSPTTLSRPPFPAHAAPLRRAMVFGWILLALLPFTYIATQAVMFSRDVVFWDEFDTALDLILRIDAGASWRELLERFFAVNSEHRMVTSRLLFALSYWLTGTLNFHVFAALGNLFLVAGCVVLVLATPTWQQRLRMGVVLAFLLFQLEHFENFLWSGASIDHFQVPMLAIGAVAAAVHGSARALALAGVLALLATFTLAHGTLVWPICALLLLHQRRWRQLAGWCICAAVAGAAFLYGFEINPSHRIEAPLDAALGVGRYWLALVGAPLTLGDAGFAPIPGAFLILILAILLARGGLAREPLALGTALFALASLGLIAFGRVEVATPYEINSRYLVLGALAWAMVIVVLLNVHATAARPFRALVWIAPALIGFNLSANLRYAPLAAGFIEVRDRAYTMFKQHGVDGRGIVRLHPREGHADNLLRQAEERGIYHLPRVSYFAEFSEIRPNPHIVAHVDQFLATSRSITIGGWGMLPGVTSHRGQVHVVLRSTRSQLVLTTVTLQRPDVAKAYNEPRWHFSGFRAVISPQRLPAEDFEIGVLLADGDAAEVIMTPHRLLLSSGSPRALVAQPSS